MGLLFMGSPSFSIASAGPSIVPPEFHGFSGVWMPEGSTSSDINRPGELNNGLNKLTFRDAIAHEVKQFNEIAASLRSSQ
jgi:hypothetical protein